MTQETIVRNISLTQVGNGSLTSGTPSKGGEIKVYLDFNNPDECKRIIKTTVEMSRFMQELRD